MHHRHAPLAAAHLAALGLRDVATVDWHLHCVRAAVSRAAAKQATTNEAAFGNTNEQLVARNVEARPRPHRTGSKHGSSQG